MGSQHTPLKTGTTTESMTSVSVYMDYLWTEKPPELNHVLVPDVPEGFNGGLRVPQLNGLRQVQHQQSLGRERETDREKYALLEVDNSMLGNRTEVDRMRKNKEAE
jgi:hypothetical protein